MAISLPAMRYLQKIHKVYLISGLPDGEVRMAGMIPVKSREEGQARVYEDTPDLKRVMALPCGALPRPILESFLCCTGGAIRLQINPLASLERSSRAKTPGILWFTRSASEFSRPETTGNHFKEVASL